MAVPATTVAIAFDTTAFDPDVFTLDDPVKGVLDSAYEMTGDVLQDLSDYVRSVQVTRGRSRELDRYSTGQATVVLDNRARTFDPTDVSTAYIGQIKPRKALQIATGGMQRLVGNVQDWLFNFDVSGDATASVVGVDGFAVLARQSVDDFAVGSATTADRVSDILDAAGVEWPAALRDIEAGGVSLIAGTASGNALQYIQAIEAVEDGAFFMSRDGLATWRNRGVTYTDTSYDAASTYDAAGTAYSYPLPDVTTDLVFTDEDDDGSGTYCDYMTLSLELGTDVLRNQVTVTRQPPSVTYGPDLGSGSGLTQTVTTTIGEQYRAGASGVTGITLGGTALTVDSGYATFTAAGTSSALVGTGGSGPLTVTLVTTGPTSITVDDGDSQAAYGIAAYSVDGSYLATDAAGTALANHLLNKYREPVVRISEISVELAGLPSSVQSRVLDLDLGDVVPVRFRPASTGARIERVCIVEGISDDIRPDRHRISFRLSGAPGN